MAKRKQQEKVRVTASLPESVIEFMNKLREENDLLSTDNPEMVKNAVMQYLYLLKEAIAGSEIVLHRPGSDKEYVVTPIDLMHSDGINER
jgi:hypothetical protein